MYVSNELLRRQEYYPFGLQTANSWTRENTTGNNFLGNGGTELNTTSNLYDLHYRNYDPALGRMNQIDPMASKYASLTPYNFAFNDPVYWNDTNGAEPTSDGWRYIQESRNYDRERNYYNTHGVIGDDDMYGSMFNRMGAGSNWEWHNAMSDDAKAVKKGTMSPAEYGARYGTTLVNKGTWLSIDYTFTLQDFSIPGYVIHALKDRWVDNWVLVKYEKQASDSYFKNRWLKNHYYGGANYELSMGAQASFLPTPEGPIPVPYIRGQGAGLYINLGSLVIAGKQVDSHSSVQSTSSGKTANQGFGITVGGVS